ncbi:vWA domain-containing protein [Calothrix sp. 336/3]|uniref:vWA domain-containing protein n=1 Tax=Calothrix sp. 336/3 TaxID=1337936 RepID=UPI0004E3BBFE|nr:vWA domain-containing protein [Calothrix sp. 336/3]AKG24642.1 hypothetical protein IJ00_14135 [Calothrix sp. 336/3]
MLKNNNLNHVDICFVVDTTGSMGGFIQTAQKQLLDTINLLSSDSQINLQVGLVEYRDHPPQDHSFITRIYPLTNNLQQMQKSINLLRADGGGDAPEAVYDGIHDACTKMQWRLHSCRFVLLVGDAPPHGFGQWLKDMQVPGFVNDHSDTWKGGCPSGLDIQKVTAVAENHRVTVHSLCMGNDSNTQKAFQAISQGTGGQFTITNATDIIGKIIDCLHKEFQNLELDQQVLSTIANMGYLDIQETAELLDLPRLPVATSISRLGKRGFL